MHPPYFNTANLSFFILWIMFLSFFIKNMIKSYDYQTIGTMNPNVDSGGRVHLLFPRTLVIYSH